MLFLVLLSPVLFCRLYFDCCSAAARGSNWILLCSALRTRERMSEEQITRHASFALIIETNCECLPCFVVVFVVCFIFVFYRCTFSQKKCVFKKNINNISKSASRLCFVVRFFRLLFGVYFFFVFYFLFSFFFTTFSIWYVRVFRLNAVCLLLFISLAFLCFCFCCCFCRCRCCCYCTARDSKAKYQHGKGLFITKAGFGLSLSQPRVGCVVGCVAVVGSA